MSTTICKKINILDCKKLFKFCPSEPHLHEATISITWSGLECIEDKIVFVEDIDDQIVSESDSITCLFEVLAEDLKTTDVSLVEVSIEFKEMIGIRINKNYGAK